MRAPVEILIFTGRAGPKFTVVHTRFVHIRWGKSAETHILVMAHTVAVRCALSNVCSTYFVYLYSLHFV